MRPQPERDAPSQTEFDSSRRQRIWAWLRRDVFFYGLVLLLVVIALLLVWPYFSSILGAIAAVIILKPLYDWFLNQRWLRDNTKWATILTIITGLLLVGVPAILFLSAALSQAQDLISILLGVNGGNSIQELLGNIERGIQQAPGGSRTQINEPQITNAIQDLLSTAGVWLADTAISLGAALPKMFVSVIIAIAIMMGILPRYENVSRAYLTELIPFPEEITELYIHQTQSMITAMFRGTFVIAFAQGAALGFVLWVAGVPSVVFFTLISMAAALLPIVGLSIVAWPIGIILLLLGQTWQGLWVLGAYLLVVQNIDVFLRPRLVPPDARLAPALLLLGVFGGIQLLGLIGALYGPVIMILLVTSVSVYTKYILRTDLQPFLDDNGRLDLQKLGLESARDETGAPRQQAWVERLANRALERLLHRDESPNASSSGR